MPLYNATNNGKLPFIGGLSQGNSLIFLHLPWQPTFYKRRRQSPLRSVAEDRNTNSIADLVRARTLNILSEF